jgi:hypothetical protein
VGPPVRNLKIAGRRHSALGSISSLGLACKRNEAGVLANRLPQIK